MTRPWLPRCLMSLSQILDLKIFPEISPRFTVARSFDLKTSHNSLSEYGYYLTRPESLLVYYYYCYYYYNYYYYYYTTTTLWKTAPLTITIPSVNIDGLWGQVQLHNNVGPSTRNMWSFKTGDLSWQWSFTAPIQKLTWCWNNSGWDNYETLAMSTNRSYWLI